jgi:hypothetical protein
MSRQDNRVGHFTLNLRAPTSLTSTRFNYLKLPSLFRLHPPSIEAPASFLPYRRLIFLFIPPSPTLRTCGIFCRVHIQHTTFVQALMLSVFSPSFSRKISSPGLGSITLSVCLPTTGPGLPRSYLSRQLSPPTRLVYCPDMVSCFPDS